MKRRMVFACIATFAVSVAWIPLAHADQLSSAKQKAEQIQHQQKQTKEKINQLKHKEQTIAQQITQIEASIQKLDASINHTQADITDRKTKIEKLQKQIAVTQTQLNGQEQTLQDRVRVIYEDGQSNYLDVLFSATSFSDFLDRLQYLSDIARQDKLVLNQINENKKQLQTAKSEVSKQLAAVQQSYQLLLKQQNQQKDEQRNEQTLLTQVHSSELSQQADLKSENSAMQGLKELIKKLQAEEGTYHGASQGWTWPVPGHYHITSPYGWRTWADGSREFHNGIDIGAPLGSKMVAATNGKVLYAGSASGFGDWVVIESAGGLIEVYGHMYAYQLKVKPGQIVAKGQQIASVGNNGHSTGPHLHFTVATGFNSAGFPISVNPTRYVGSGKH